MPIWLRRFTLQEMNKHFEEERKQYEKLDKKSSPAPRGPSLKKPSHTLKKPK